MGFIALQIPQIGALDSTEAPKIVSDFTALQTLLNGNIDVTNLSSTLRTLVVQPTLGRAGNAGLFPGITGYTAGSFQPVETATIVVAQTTAYLLVTGFMSGYTVTSGQATNLFANIDSFTTQGAFLGNVIFEDVNVNKTFGGSSIVGPVSAGLHTVGLVVYPETNTLSISNANSFSLTAIELPA